MKLLSVVHVGTSKTHNLKLAADDGAEHPVSGKPHWEIIEHRGHDGAKSARPLVEVFPSVDGHSAVVKTLAWPGQCEIEVSADAILPTPSSAMPRFQKITSTIVIVIPEIPEIAETLDLRVVPEGVYDFPAAK